MTDWKARAIAAEQRVVELEGEIATLRASFGRPRKLAETEDQRLVALALQTLGISQRDLAVRLGMSSKSGAALARPKLPAIRRQQIEALIAASGKRPGG